MVQTIESDTEWKRVMVGVVVSRWNSIITDEMLSGALRALGERGIEESHIILVRCPGSYELPLSCKYLLDRSEIDGVVAIGAVIRGDTPHFDYVCQAVNRGISDLNLEYGKPVSFGVLTTDTVEQALERAGVKKGNKGAEAALALCDMIALKYALRR